MYGRWLASSPEQTGHDGAVAPGYIICSYSVGHSIERTSSIHWGDGQQHPAKAPGDYNRRKRTRGRGGAPAMQESTTRTLHARIYVLDYIYICMIKGGCWEIAYFDIDVKVV
jgi:hypothetical protein